LPTETPPQPAPPSTGSDGGPPRRPPINIYDTRTLKRRRPRWVRIALWTGGSLFALVLAVLQWRKRRLFGEHLVFSLHFTAFWLIAVFIGIYGGSNAVITAFAHYGIRFHVGNWDNFLFPFALVTLLVYSFVALRTVYGDSILGAILKALILAGFFHYALDIYRFILFLTALYLS
jgi:hypothetical protein